MFRRLAVGKNMINSSRRFFGTINRKRIDDAIDSFLKPGERNWCIGAGTTFIGLNFVTYYYPEKGYLFPPACEDDNLGMARRQTFYMLFSSVWYFTVPVSMICYPLYKDSLA